MLSRIYEVMYFGNHLVSSLSSDAVLQWTCREMSCKVSSKKVNITIHDRSIKILGESGMIAAIPFSYQSPYSCGTCDALLYITELCAKPNKLKCHVFQLLNEKRALKLREEIVMLQQGSLQATQRSLQRQESDGARLKRSHSAENLIFNTLMIPGQSSRRKSDEIKSPKSHQRRKSTPVKCRDIFEVEYIGVQPAPASELPNIDEAVRKIQKKVDQGRQDSIKPLSGLLHIGLSEIQLLHSDHTVIRAWPITKIKACAQGHSSEYFGWTCREDSREEQCCVNVFRAKDAAQGVSIIHSLHKVCMSAYNKYRPSSDSCKYCPIVIFNSVCDKLMDLDEDEVAQELGKVIDSLCDRDRLEVLTMFKTDTKDVKIKNNCLIGCLRNVYEQQQQRHVHNSSSLPKVPSKVEIRRPVSTATPPTARRGSRFPLFRHIREAYHSDSESDGDARTRPKNPHMRVRSRTDADQDGENKTQQPLTTASDRRRIRRQQSCRKAIYDSVHTTSKTRENLVSHQRSHYQRSDSCGSLSSLVSTGYDVLSEREKEQMQHWENLFKKEEAEKNNEHFQKEVEYAVYSGVPESVRGRVWRLLSSRRKCKKEVVTKPHLPYQELVKSASVCQNAIALDIGRTFPNHAYFQGAESEGQTQLSNMLRAYSTHDIEVGYCQGMSFIAGILLVYLDEEDAFNLFLELLNKYDLRDNYKPDMAGLKMRLYQLSRLVHDQHLSVHEHLNTYEVTPFLYAVSWVMTSFATQLPFHVATRILDFVFLQGIDAIFKVILYIIQTSEKEILALKSFDSIINYMKETIPAKIAASFEYHICDIFSSDLSADLRDLQIEYKVLHEDLSIANKTELLEAKYDILKQQNKCQSNQITLLNRELEKSRAEKRALADEVEKLKSEGDLAQIKSKYSLHGSIISQLHIDIDDLKSENVILRVKLAELTNATLERMEEANGSCTTLGDPLSIVNLTNYR